ncbi:peptidoglycan DD-metalloendopeptidase family protein [Pseudoteredinibacter isoporae]|uniref:Murein DD-endopeptidase MepM/ murein hydrolase activator NlpD n=1 Tax=Pseudoteredinibacter isoporae TaxID=570281 RepID=A0A7X0JQN4_9GAMM|nr:M23 family metallopeptidase [Pseudoteredinibacter isoporae]MBB6520513.1 murein DD-endopeptidase MepM/ murein hydrolase activator NlpD [Pseudoteredinibacter isoporae]NHO86080.1 M23 family metallopeptidase [Pseudoteredinibacter isoporae]NIB25469.1 M23 family metallopeptidase [Pseudoteredinibacter isoporae]
MPLNFSTEPKRPFPIRLGLLAVLLSYCLTTSTSNAQSKIYKYKDENGKWVFTDKKPKQAAETIQLKTRGNASKHEPWLETLREDGKHRLFLNNPVHAPIQFIYRASRLGKKRFRFSAEGPGRFLLREQDTAFGEIKSGWAIGKLNVVHSQSVYELPFSSKKRLLISQGFNGRFSHTGIGNRNALDIAMEVGTDIAAARPGVVAIAKDDYHMGGAKSFFLDKANHITVYHDDGSSAIYAHILQGSAKVKPGDKVRAGQLIARAGSSGYSTGPHLHFVIRGIVGGRVASLPFRLRGRDGKTFNPRAGQKI